MPIPADHYMCQKKDDLTKICSSFFAATGINYFQYYRIYNDSYVHGMLTNTDTLKRFIELDFPSFSSYKECDRVNILIGFCGMKNCHGYLSKLAEKMAYTMVSLWLEEL
ncbi:MAG UNVERIFIED_CONTAM: hypothetical protein LVQ98_06565 [Rickettsiaceae bacterium]|jgi:hypothetical protein